MEIIGIFCINKGLIRDEESTSFGILFDIIRGKSVMVVETCIFPVLQKNEYMFWGHRKNKLYSTVLNYISNQVQNISI